MILRIIALCAILLTSSAVLSPQARAYNYEESGTGGAIWIWDINDPDGDINEVEIWRNGAEVNGDGYDDWGLVNVDGNDITGAHDEADFANGTYTYEDGAGTSVSVTIVGNSVTWQVTSNAEFDLEIHGDLGSDGDSTFVTLGNRFYSYEEGGDNGPDNDPIIYWETDGTIDFTDGDDEPRVFLTGTSLRLMHRIYGHENNESLSTAAYLALFAQWVAENPNRTDIFTTTWSPKKSVIEERQTVNLSFAQSRFGSDKLYDPTGELRRLVDFINQTFN